MADVNISKYRASVVRSGSAPATPGFVVSEGQNPVEPAGSEQNHLPVTINATATGLAITTDQVLSGAGTVGQYIRGDGSLADFPASTGGGSSVSYYLNGSISQGTIGGVAYKELSKTPILGAGTQFTINADGYIASFLTDAGDPNLLEIPGGNWNFETYFSASSGGGSPTFYVELYKYDGSTFTLIASNSGNPELIAFGTNVNSYFSTLAVPTTALTLTDRLAIRYYVTHSGRTITLHTENNTLCQIITTFTTGLTALNGLTAQVQYFAVGTSGTDFNIASATQTHTFNLPTASASNRGALSSADWSTFNAKQNVLTLTTTGSSGASTLVGATLNVPTYTLSGLGGVPTSRQLTINGTAFDLSADRSWSVGTVTSVGLSSATSGVTIGNTPVTGSGTITLAIATATSTQQGLLSSTDWSTFNNKQNALTLTTTGTSGAATLVGATLNIPQYQAAGTYVTSVTASSPLASSGGTTPNITIQQASGSQSGFLSSTDWTTFNNKQNALTNPVTGTGTTNYLPKFTGSTTVGNSQVFDNGTNVGIGTTSPDRKLGILVSPSATGDDGINITNGSTPFILTRTGASYTYRGVAANAGMIYSSSNIALLADGSNITFHNGNGQVASIQSNGNLLVGTTTDNGAKLNVNGTVFIGNLASGSNAILDFATNASGAPRSIIYRAATAFLDFTNTAGSAVFQLSNGGAATFSGSVTAGGDILTPTRVATDTINGYTGGSTPLTIQTGGAQEVRIGTNATTRLTISSTGAATFSSSVNVGGVSANTDFRIYRTVAPSVFFSVSAPGGTPNTSILGINGTDVMSLNASGNVGIGTSSPGYKIEVAGANSQYWNGTAFTGTPLALAISNTTAGGYDPVLILQQADSGGTVKNAGAIGLVGRASWTAGNNASQISDMYFLVRNSSGGISERMRITSEGNVGIGTTSPTTLLQVEGSAPIFTMNRTSGGLINRINFSSGGTNYASIISDASAGEQRYSMGPSAGWGGYHTFYTDTTERMRITSGGNVLIGTTSNFTFLGTTSLNVDRNFNSGHNIRISNQANNSSASANLILGTFGNSWVNGLGSNSSTLGNNLYWAVDASTSPLQYKMVLTTGGNLLIGTTTDNSHKLRVNGTGYFDTGIKTGNPVGSTTNDWLLGRALVSGTSTPDRWIRVQIGNLYYDILAVYMGSV